MIKNVFEEEYQNINESEDHKDSESDQHSKSKDSHHNSINHVVNRIPHDKDKINLSHMTGDSREIAKFTDNSHREEEKKENFELFFPDFYDIDLL